MCQPLIKYRPTSCTSTIDLFACNASFKPRADLSVTNHRNCQRILASDKQTFKNHLNAELPRQPNILGSATYQLRINGFSLLLIRSHKYAASYDEQIRLGLI